MGDFSCCSVTCFDVLLRRCPLGQASGKRSRIFSVAIAVTALPESEGGRNSRWTRRRSPSSLNSPELWLFLPKRGIASFVSKAPHLGIQGSRLSCPCPYSPLHGFLLSFHSWQNGFYLGPQMCHSLEHKHHEGATLTLFSMLCPQFPCAWHTVGLRNICEGMNTTHSIATRY